MLLTIFTNIKKHARSFLNCGANSINVFSKIFKHVIFGEKTVRDQWSQAYYWESYN